MMELTAEAQRLLDDYLRRADVYLRSTPSADAEEVERDLREHVARELQSASPPVSAADMEAVLRRLGPPEDLVPPEELPWWQQVARRWHTGPQDWRLAYISLGVLVFGTPLAGPLAVLASFLVARAALETVGEERDLGPQRWFLYPALLLVYIPLAVLLLFWPVAWLVPALFQSFFLNLYAPWFRAGHSPLPLSIGCAGLGLPLWWLVLATIVRHHPRFLPTLFRPFVHTSGFRIVDRLALFGLLLLGLFLAILFAGASHA